MGCHANGAISHSPNRDFSLGQIRSHLVCPGKRFGTHETVLGAGCKIGLISCRPGINIVFFIFIVSFYPIIVSNDTIKSYFLVATCNYC